MKGCCRFAVHPLGSVSQLARLVVRLLVALTQPETWSKIGAGCLGASFGQTLVTGNPLSLLGIGIGTACLLGGVSIGALRAALLADEGNRAPAAWENCKEQLTELPETALTGFFTGMLIGNVQAAIQHRRIGELQHEMKGWILDPYKNIKHHPDEFIRPPIFPPSPLPPCSPPARPTVSLSGIAQISS